MTRALIVKELRESVVLVALAAVAIVYALLSLAGWSVGAGSAPTINWQIPFVETNFTPVFGGIAAVVAALMGLKQSAWEDMRGTYHYLLHRAIDRRRIMAVKLGVGLALVMLTAAAMIVLHGLWAATPGKHGSPFLWSMTSDAWRLWVTLPIAYLAAFLSGLRPAAWYGTRLAPLVAAGGIVLLLCLQPWFALAAIVSAVLSAVLVACVMNLADGRDY